METLPLDFVERVHALLDFSLPASGIISQATHTFCSAISAGHTKLMYAFWPELISWSTAIPLDTPPVFVPHSGRPVSGMVHDRTQRVTITNDLLCSMHTAAFQRMFSHLNDSGIPKCPSAVVDVIGYGLLTNPLLISNHCPGIDFLNYAECFWHDEETGQLLTIPAIGDGLDFLVTDTLLRHVTNVDNMRLFRPNTRLSRHKFHSSVADCFEFAEDETTHRELTDWLIRVKYPVLCGSVIQCYSAIFSRVALSRNIDRIATFHSRVSAAGLIPENLFQKSDWDACVDAGVAVILCPPITSGDVTTPHTAEDTVKFLCALMKHPDIQMCASVRSILTLFTCHGADMTVPLLRDIFNCYSPQTLEELRASFGSGALLATVVRYGNSQNALGMCEYLIDEIKWPFTEELIIECLRVRWPHSLVVLRWLLTPSPHVRATQVRGDKSDWPSIIASRHASTWAFDALLSHGWPTQSGLEPDHHTGPRYLA